MSKRSDYLDYLDILISDNYANYWKFEIERNDTPSDQYKADTYLSVISNLEKVKTFYVENVEGFVCDESINKYKEYIYSLHNEYDIFSIQSMTLDIIILSLRLLY